MLAKAGIKIEPLPETLTVAANPNAPKGPKIVETSIDDDPVLGNKDAPVTIVEFSDYDCPFCRVFNETTYKQIKQTYIDTGKVKFVYRDLPIKQLHPLAFEKAVSINCAREQGGDETYYKYHDALFQLAGKIQSSPTKDDLKKLAVSLNLNADQFNGCLDSGKYDNEISLDIADAVKINAFGTPTFIIGKTNGDGSVKGEMIEGAAPFEEYKRIIDELLK
jgi:protein-disulfide isomerase